MKTTRITLLLMALAACSTERTEKAEKAEKAERADSAGQVRSSLTVRAAEPVLIRKRGSVSAPSAVSAGPAVPHFRSDTLAWADSTIRGETTFVTRGRAITTTQVVTDSQWIHLALPALATGVPFGLFAGWDGNGLKPGAELSTMTYGGTTPATLLAGIATARAQGLRMVISMTGGARANYLTAGVFDMNKWTARMSRFNTPEIRSAVAAAVSEGILIGNSVMDEPFNDGGPGNQGNSWGPAGTMTKARVDSMCGYVRTIFPTLAEGVFHDYRLAADSSYQVCDFVTTQYRAAKGTLTDYRDGALALCRRDRHACSFAINLLDGGIPVKKVPGQTDFGPDDCPLTTTGGRGTYFPNCRMTAEQVRDAGRILGSVGCFLTGFRYDSAFMASPANQAALRDVSATLAGRPATACIRS